MKKILKIFTLCFTLSLSIFAFSINAMAKDFECVYGEAGSFNFNVYLDENGTVKYASNNIQGVVINNASLPIGKFIVNDGSDNYYCPKELRLKRIAGNPGDRFASYDLAIFSDYTDSDAAKKEYTIIVELTDSKIDNAINPNPNQNKTLVRSCSYGENGTININYYDDDTATGTFNGNTIAVGADVIKEMKNSCPEELYIVHGQGVLMNPNWSDAQSSTKVTLNKKSSYKEDDEQGIGGDAGAPLTCKNIFGDPKDSTYPAYWIQWCLNVMKYLAIGSLLLFVTMDFFKALVQNDKDALKKAGTNAAKRFAFCVLIFFLPIIIEFIMSMFGAYGTCGIG